MESSISKEAIFLYNNLFFIIAFIIVFLGTLYPLFVEVMKFQKVSVGPPYYNAVFMPVAWGLIFLMGVGPYIPWRKCSVAALRAIFTLPLSVGFCSVPFLYLVGITDPYALAALSVTLFTGTAIVQDYFKLASVFSDREGINLFRGFLRGLNQNPRKAAGILTHVGILVMTVGVVFSTLFQTEKMQIIKPGEVMPLNQYQVKLQKIYPTTGGNWSGYQADFEIVQGDKLIVRLSPQKRIYEVSQTPTTEAAIHQIYTGHLFLTIPEVAPDGSWVRVRALHNPLVLWVWYGGAIMVIGCFLNIFRREKRRMAHAGAETIAPVAPALLMPETTSQEAQHVVRPLREI
jgi:cytochrome c-type biogenesis protein CcmF